MRYKCMPLVLGQGLFLSGFYMSLIPGYNSHLN